MKKIVLILPFLLIFPFHAQNRKAYDSIYIKTYKRAVKDLPKALKVADSLYRISETPYFQTRSLMLSATFYQNSGDPNKAVEYGERAAKIIEKTDDMNWKVRVYGLLATEYRLLELYSQSEYYWKKAYVISNNIEDPQKRNFVLGVLFQEKSMLENDRNDNKSAIRSVQKSQEYFKHIGQQQETFFLYSSHNQQLLADYYNELDNLPKALGHYEKALRYYKDKPANDIVGFVYNGLASLYLKKKNLDSAKKYIDLAQKVVENSQYLMLKNRILKTSKRYYSEVNDMEKLKEVIQKEDTVENKLEDKTTSFMDKSYVSMNTKIENAEKKVEKTEDESSTKTYLIGLAGIILLSGAVYFVIYKKKQQRDIAHFRQIIKRLDEESRQNAEKYIVEDGSEDWETNEKRGEIEEIEYTDSVPSNETGAVMTSETESRILARLHKFERSNTFTNRNMSLPFLASHLDTNTRYLSHIINTHKEKDFNNYINELRINYIITKLKNEPKYRKYKMATLAEETGFSSLSKFTTVFKKVTTVSPALFVKYLKEDEEPEKLVPDETAV